MIANKYMTKAAAVLMAAAAALCLLAVLFQGQLFSAAGGTGVTMEYESKLFDTSKVLEINILMEDADWQALLDSAINEEYVTCDVEIGGETFYQVGIRPKGNTSLSSIVNDPETDRYSLKLEFDQFVDGQTCYGLDKLILNNSYADATYMKEALIYRLFQELDADASLYNYAKVSVNGEYWGLYLALEAVEDSFLLRNYGTANGKLYKPENMDGDREEMPNTQNRDFSKMQRPEKNTAPAGDGQQPPAPNTPIAHGLEPPEVEENRDFKGGRGGMTGGSGSNLNYTDDALDSYSTIWEGEITGTGDGDHKRVVTALKNISQGTDLERYMDIDNLISYMAVHIFSQNADSLSGNMAHNYYLYEYNGRLNLLPWDYNLAFGGMGMDRGGSSEATATVNGAIDDAWGGTNFFDTLLASEEYHAAYYAAMEQVVHFIQNGGFEEFYTHTRSLIDPLVKTDPTAFYSYQEYSAAAEALYQVVSLRGQSIAGQLDGSIPSTQSQQAGSLALIDASHIDLSVLGSMNRGGGNHFGAPGEAPVQPPQGTPPADSAEKTPDSPGGSEASRDGEGFHGFVQPGTTADEAQPDGQSPPNQGQPGGANAPGMGVTEEAPSGALLSYGLCFGILLAAFLLALLYRPRPRKR